MGRGNCFTRVTGSVTGPEVSPVVRVKVGTSGFRIGVKTWGPGRGYETHVRTVMGPGRGGTPWRDELLSRRDDHPLNRTGVVLQGVLYPQTPDRRRRGVRGVSSPSALVTTPGSQVSLFPMSGPLPRVGGHVPTPVVSVDVVLVPYVPYTPCHQRSDGDDENFNQDGGGEYGGVTSTTSRHR